MMKYHEFIGDGVYAMFDGYQIWLAVGAHDNPPVVALEPEVLVALNDYARSINRKVEADTILARAQELDPK